MPSFSKSLELVLHKALSLANERRHEYATLEHLLLALIDDPDAAQVMQACGVDLGDLGDVVRQYLDLVQRIEVGSSVFDTWYQGKKTAAEGDKTITRDKDIYSNAPTVGG